MNDADDNAAVAYTAYKHYIDGVFVPRGAMPLPPWESLTDTYRRAWAAALAGFHLSDPPTPEKAAGAITTGSGA